MSNMMQRTASMCSLPSPPADTRADYAQDARMEGEEDSDDPDKATTNFGLVPQRPSCLTHGSRNKSHAMFEREEANDEEVDELETEDEGLSSDEPLHKKQNVSRRAPAFALGSPVNVSTCISSRASRKQLLNPFFLSSDSKSSLSRDPYSSSAAFSAPPQQYSSSSLTSPVRHPRRRVDPDRVKLNQQHITPPQKTRTELQQERIRQEEEETRSNKRSEMMGWDDPDNPFLDKNDEMFKRTQAKRELRRPETLTYVKRGERIQTSIPFTAVLTSSCPSDDPFTYTTPRLLFPPAPPKVPTTPPSSFLQALRASVSTTSAAPPESTVGTIPVVNKPHADRTTELPPTPVTMKRKKHSRSSDISDPSSQESSNPSSSSGPGYKKMRLPNSESQHHYHQRTGLRH